MPALELEESLGLRRQADVEEDLRFREDHREGAGVVRAAREHEMGFGLRRLTEESRDFGVGVFRYPCQVHRGLLDVLGVMDEEGLGFQCLVLECRVEPLGQQLLHVVGWRQLRLAREEAVKAIPRTNINTTSSARMGAQSAAAARKLEADRVWTVDTTHNLMITEPKIVSEMLLRLAALERTRC